MEHKDTLQRVASHNDEDYRTKVVNLFWVSKHVQAFLVTVFYNPIKKVLDNLNKDPKVFLKWS